MTATAEYFYDYGYPSPGDFVGTIYEGLEAEELEVIKRRYRKDPAELLASLPQLDVQDDKLSFLDKLAEEDYGRKYEIAHALAEASSERVLQAYGPEILAWTAANAGLDSLGERHREGLEKLLGVDAVLFEKARLWDWQNYGKSSGHHILQHYAFMENIGNGALNNLDISAALRSAVRPGIELKDDRIADYSLMPLRAQEARFRPDGWEQTWISKELSPNVTYSIWLDTPTGFALLYKGVPQAVVGLVPNAEVRNELVVCQLQGVQGSRVNPNKSMFSDEYVVSKVGARGLMPFDWQKLMVNLSSNLAISLGYSNLSIQGGANNLWVRTRLKNETEPHLPLELAKTAYDEPAQRLGFAQSEDGNWHKAIAAER